MPISEALIAAGIAGAVNLGGGIVQQAMSNKAASEANEQARKWQLADRLHDEQYNNPVAQAFRLRQAGIGGDYSNLVSSGQTKSNTTPVQVPDQVMSLNSIGTAALDSYNQVRSTDADIAVSKAQENLLSAQKDKLNVETQIAQIELEFKREREELEIAHQKGENAYLKVKTDNEKVQNAIQQVELNVAKSTEQARIDLVNLNVNNLQLQNYRLQFEIKGVKYDVECLKPIEASQAQKVIDYYDSLVDKTKADIDAIRKDIAGMDLQQQILFQELIINGPNEQLALELSSFFNQNEEQLEKFVKAQFKSDMFDNNVFVKSLKPVIELIKGISIGVGAYSGAKSNGAFSRSGGSSYGGYSSYSR